MKWLWRHEVIVMSWSDCDVMKWLWRHENEGEAAQLHLYVYRENIWRQKVKNALQYLNYTTRSLFL
jgi:hypothetical protein